jgi:hypothetical protein
MRNSTALIAAPDQGRIVVRLVVRPQKINLRFLAPRCLSFASQSRPEFAGAAQSLVPRPGYVWKGATRSANRGKRLRSHVERRKQFARLDYFGTAPLEISSRFNRSPESVTGGLASGQGLSSAALRLRPVGVPHHHPHQSAPAARFAGVRRAKCGADQRSPPPRDWLLAGRFAQQLGFPTVI